MAFTERFIVNKEKNIQNLKKIITYLENMKKTTFQIFLNLDDAVEPTDVDIAIECSSISA